MQFVVLGSAAAGVVVCLELKEREPMKDACLGGVC